MIFKIESEKDKTKTKVIQQLQTIIKDKDEQITECELRGERRYNSILEKNLKMQNYIWSEARVYFHKNRQNIALCKAMYNQLVEVTGYRVYSSASSDEELIDMVINGCYTSKF